MDSKKVKVTGIDGLDRGKELKAKMARRSGKAEASVRRCLVVHAHPNPDSYNTALRKRVVDALAGVGHEVDLIDLYAIDYDPNISADEHRAYETNAASGHPDPVVADHISRVQAADTLIFVYPTWWQGLPAILKGWLDRTLIPGVSFTLSPSRSGKTTVRPALTNITRIVGITSYGSSPLVVALMGDGGRRTLTRSIRLVCNRRCRTTWLGLKRVNGASDQQRAAFLDRVESTLKALT